MLVYIPICPVYHYCSYWTYMFAHLAADGAGLGHDFLRHIDRCRLLIHMVDVSGSEGRDPVEDFETINAELREYSPELAGRKMIVAANKTDILADRTLLDKP